VKLRAATLRVPGGVFSGLTAAWLHELPVNPSEPVEMTLPPGAPIAGRASMRIRRATLAEKDVKTAKGFRVTAIERTLADLSATQTLTEVVVLAEAATHARLTTRSRLAAAARAASGRPGVSTFRRVVDLVESATESPMETRLRMLLLLAGLPRPVAQQRLEDEHGEFLARLDLYYPDARLGIEYDGATHKTSLAEDNRRQNRLIQAGVRLLRFTAGDLYDRPDAVIAEVRGMLAVRADSAPTHRFRKQYP
jgi:very-short-patch-repair endonuclease